MAFVLTDGGFITFKRCAFIIILIPTQASASVFMSCKKKEKDPESTTTEEAAPAATDTAAIDTTAKESLNS